MAVRKEAVTDQWSLGDLRDTFVTREVVPDIDERGLRFLSEIDDLSPPLLVALKEALAAMGTRCRLIDDVKNEVIGLDAKLAALHAAGYPAPLVRTLPEELQKELLQAIASITAARERFTGDTPAATGADVSFGKGTKKGGG